MNPTTQITSQTLSDDDEGLDAADQLFALDDAGGVWRGNVGEDDNDGPFPAWYRLEIVPLSGQIVQIAIVSAPRDSRRDGVAMERLFALCNDGSVWLKILIIGREQAWVRLPDIPQHEIAQISAAWAPYQGSRGTLWAPLTDSTDRLFALCRDGSVWLFHPFSAWPADAAIEALEAHWDRLPGLPAG